MADAQSEGNTPAWHGGPHPDRRMKLGVILPMGEGDLDGRTVRYSDLLALAQAAEQAGLDSVWLADHLLARMPDEPEQGVWEVFTFLSALAVQTQHILLGPLVACTSFRAPGLLAKMAVGLDELSGGRSILGLGAGWHEPEYTAFGYPFDHRAARFEEALEIIVPLLREGQIDFQGQYYSARNGFLRPRGPSLKGPPIWIGAFKPRMLHLAARHADGFNTVWHEWPAGAVPHLDAFRQACADVGRDPASAELTVGTFADLLAPGEASKNDARKDDEKHIAGSAEEVAEALAGFADIGTQHLIVILDPPDLRGIERFARVVELLDRQLR
jgi:alkanesulfonate monooxygenase SsuD/methylene tetrahydromethanopterin reductase-like flavin-dependent oxidoreductase (luciferase family)